MTILSGTNDAGNPPGTSANGRHLTAKHLKDLRKSGLSDQQIAACGFYSVTDPDAVSRHLKWAKPARSLGNCLSIPYPGADGYARLKPDNPRRDKKTGKPIKYEAPKGTPNRLYVPPGTAHALSDVTVPLVITEGEKKAAKADQDGFPCLGLSGVYAWQRGRKRSAGGKGVGRRELIPDLSAVRWAGRTVPIIFDSDSADNEQVRWAEWHLSEALRREGAIVKVVRLPPGPPGPGGKPSKLGLDDFLVAHGADGPARLRELLDAAGPPEKPEPHDDGRPIILLSTEEHETVEQASRALANCDPDIYQRGGKLVCVQRDSRPSGGKLMRPPGTPQIRLVPAANLRVRLTRSARFQVQKGDDLFPAHPADWLVSGVESAGAWAGVRHLEAVTESPILRADGTVLQAPGYDHETGVLYEPNGCFPSVPTRPRKAEIDQAREDLLEVVCDFPFQRPAHRGAWVSAVLTPLARFAFNGPVPLFLIVANIRGAGKGKLASPVSLIATGRELSVSTYTDDDREMRKTITAIAQQGDRLVLLDNVIGEMGCASLAAALTATDWSGRILGKSEQPRTPLLTTWLATGNNVTLIADLPRRTCTIRLHSDEEKPEDRKGFRHPDLEVWVKQERRRLLVAALTILTGYCAAGKPEMNLPGWGSYEGWSALVRSAVVWAGLEDPYLAREVYDRADAETNLLRAFIAGWQEVDRDSKGLTVAEALKKLKDSPDAYPTLHGAMCEAFSLKPGDLPGSRAVGKRLAHWEGRNVGGLCFSGRGGEGGINRWKVVSVKAESGFGGFSGFSQPPFTHARTRGDAYEAEQAQGNGWQNKPTKPTKPTDDGEACASGDTDDLQETVL
jgi:hypothetical protein